MSFLALLLAALVLAGLPALPSPPRAIDTAPAEHVQGTIAAVDRAGPSLTVETDRKPGDDDDAVRDRIVLHVDDATRFSDGEDAIELDDLRAGDRVRASYVRREGRNVAVAVARVHDDVAEAEPEPEEREPGEPPERPPPKWPPLDPEDPEHPDEPLPPEDPPSRG